MASRFRPSVLPQFPVRRSPFDDIARGIGLARTLGEAIDRRRDRRREDELADLERAREGIFRGTADETPSLTATRTGTDTFETPDPRLETDLAQAQRRSRGLFATLPGEIGDRARERLGAGESVARGPSEEFGGVSPDRMADRLATAARDGRPRPERRTPPGAFNPLRGTFEPSLEAPRTELGTEGGGQVQLTDEFFFDPARSPEAIERTRLEGDRRAALDRLVEAGVLEDDDLALASVLDPGEILRRRDDLREREDEIEQADRDEAANRAAYDAFVDQLQTVAPEAPVPAFDNDVNWVEEQIELARDVRNEGQIRTRPRRGGGVGAGEARADGTFPAMSPTQANDFIDDLLQGLPLEVTGFPPTVRASLTQKATAGTLTETDVNRAIAETRGAFGIRSRDEERPSSLAPFGLPAGADAGGRAGERPDRGSAPRSQQATDPIAEARALVQGIPAGEVREALAEAGFSASEIEQVLGR